MDRGIEMSRLVNTLALALLFGCSTKSDTGKAVERTLYFTSDFPASLNWEVRVTFRSQSGMAWCKDLSMGEGGLVQQVKYEEYSLKKSGDTLRVPLFWSKKNNCDWRMIDLSLRPDGRPIAFLGLNLKDKSQFIDQSKPLTQLPAALAYQCKSDSGDMYLRCKIEAGKSVEEYVLPDSVQSIHFQVDLKGS